MNPHCDLELVTTTTTKICMTLWLMICITIPSLATKCSVVQKLLSIQTFTDILNLQCDLDLVHSKPFFLLKVTLAYQTKFGKQNSTLEDIVEIVILLIT